MFPNPAGVSNWKQEVLQILLLQTPFKTSQRFDFCCRLSLCDTHHHVLAMAFDAESALHQWLLPYLASFALLFSPFAAHPFPMPETHL
jgi:hypothetical protein